MRTLAALLLIAGTAFAQAADSKTCSIDGTVTNSVTHAPIPRAQLEVTLPDRVHTAQSGATGKWRVDGLPCGPVAVTVSRISYVEKKPFSLNAPAQDVAVELTPQVVLTGRVIDDQGDPILGAHVRLLTSEIVNGRRTMLSSTGAVTNDLGEYRFAGLPAGRYILCATAATGIGRHYGERCLPGPPEDEASSAQMAAGFENRFDFTLSPMPIHRVSGTVTGSPQRSDLMIRAVDAEGSWNRSNYVARTRPDGTFVLRNLPAGSYTLTAETPQSSAQRSITVTNADVENVELRLEPRITVMANLHTLSANGKTIGPKDYSVSILGDSPVSGSAPSRSEDGFSIANIIPGLYHFSFTPPKGFYLKSATLGGRDIIGPGLTVSAGMPPLEVTISDDGGTLEGDVTADGAPTTAWIYLESDGNPIRNGQADAKGHFHFDAVPPGDYQIYAWDDNSKVEYANPAWMQRYGKPVAVSVAPNQAAHVELARKIAPE